MNNFIKYIIKLGLLFACTASILFLTGIVTYADFIVRASVSAVNPDTEIDLNWDPVNGANYYKIFRNSGSGDVLIKTIDINIDRYFTSYSDKGTDEVGLVPETSYIYTVKAYSDQEMTNELASAGTTVTTDKMLKPSNIVAKYNINTNQVTLTWKNNSKALTGSVIKRIGGTGILATVTGPESTITFTDPDLIKDQQNQYTVVSTDSNGHSSEEGDAVSIFPIDPPVITVSVNNGTATISWGSYEHISNFELQRSKYTTSWEDWQTLSTQLAAGNTSMEDVLPTAGVYRYRLATKSTGSYTGYSNITESVTKPAAPRNLTAQFSSNSSISISWTNIEGNDTQLKLEKKIGNGSYSEIAVLSKDSTSYIDNFIVASNETYYYRIIAFDSENNKDVSAECSIAAVLPQAPASLSLSLESNTKIILSWIDKSTNETGFSIERKTGTGSYVLLGTVDENVTSFEDNTVSSDYTYTYRVWANSYFGNSTASSNEVAITLNTVKSPNSLDAVVVSGNTVRLTWTYPASNAYTTVIERKTGETGTWTKLYEAASGVLSYNDNTVQSNTRYFYRIKAKPGGYVYSAAYPNNAGMEVYTVFSTLKLSIINSGRIDLSWTDNATGEAGFAVERKTGSGSFERISVVEPNKTGYSDYTVTSGYVYTYRILLMNSATNSTVYTNEVSASINTIVKPISLDVDVISPYQINLAWSLSAPGSYRTVIERKTGNAGTWAEIAAIEGRMSYEDTGLSSNTQYFYRIKVYYSSNVYSQAYPNDDIGIGKYTKIVAPSNLTGIAVSSTQINLSWYSNSVDSYFIIERKTKDGSYSEVGKTDINVTSWSDINLIPNLMYTYRIKAKTVYNESDYSTVTSIMCTNLAAPTGLTAYAGGSEGIELRWVDNTLNESGFEIWRLVDNMQWELLAIVESNTRSFTDMEIKEGKKYSYMVRAFLGDDGIYSPYSSVVSVVATIPAPPDNLTYSAVNANSVKLTWRDNSNNEDGFKVERLDNSTGKWIEIASLSQNVTNYIIDNLSISTSYTYRIKAFNSTNNSYSYSSEITVSLKRPEVPSDIVVTVLSATEIRIDWSDNSENEMGFAVERKKNGGQYVEIAKVPSNTTSYVDKGLSPNQQYFYRIRSYNENGYSSYSSAKSALTKSRTIYNDIGNVRWAISAIESLTERGVIKGKAKNMFYPNDKITRAEFVAILIRMFKPDEVVAGSFVDVKGSDWFYREVMTAKNLGIISGAPGNYFYPNKPITREDAAVIITRALMALGKPLKSSKPEVLNVFKDVSQISVYAVLSVASMYSEKIITGKESNILAPKDYTTRAEAAVLLSRIADR